jgi:ParB family chromosome partitioning protein
MRGRGALTEPRTAFATSGTHTGEIVAQQRRGLGKGLGALIPEAPRTGAATGTGTMTGTPGSGSGPLGATNGTVGVQAGAPAAVYEAPDSGLRQVAGAYFEEVAVGSITPNPRQPRRTFDEEALDELAASITEVGLLQPVVVRKIGDGNFELVMGERRWRASQQAGLEYIPAIVRETPDTDMLRTSSWRRRSAGPARTSATPSGSSTCPQACSGAWRPA